MSSSKQHLVYDSNPFTAGWASIQKIFTVNPQSFVGVIVATMAIFAAFGTAILMLLFGAIGLLAKHYPNSDTMALPEPARLGIFHTTSDGTLLILCAIGIILSIGLGVLLQAVLLRFSIATASRQAVTLKRVFLPSVRAVLPLLGLAGIILLAVLLITVIIGLLSITAPIVLFMLGIAAFASILYGSLRLSFASYAVIDKNLGPIKAIKHSWAATNGRVIDIVGISAATAAVFTVPSIILDALAKVSEGIPALADTFSVLGLVLEVVLIVVAALPMAERYVQSEAVYDKKIKAVPISPFNFLAIVLLCVLLPIAQALSAQPSDSVNYNPLAPMSQQSQSNDAPQGSANAY